MNNNLKLFGCNVFNEDYLRKHISKKKFKKYKNMITGKIYFDTDLLQEVANIIKDWAISKGATHYSLWFQPLSGLTAEKQTSFLSINQDGKPIIDFPLSSLVKGETDASSFPNGGLRSVFEARGLIKWDFTYQPFIKESVNGSVLYIPTTFEAPGGISLDKRTPLLNSCDALNKQLLRMLRLFEDNESSEIFSSVGIEQEYFLIKKEDFEKRKDLMLTGKTLFGKPLIRATASHYMSSIDEETGTFMSKVEKELWKLGIPVQVKHNEAAPRQCELVPHYENLKNASNHDFLTMEVLQKEAKNMGLVCLLKEKPFKGINGSGKHINWSINTNSSKRLFSYGDTPHDNALFITMIMALVSAVDKHSDLIRATVASSDNDNRLSGYEAPSSIVSIYLGEELTNILEKIANDKKNEIKLGEVSLELSQTYVTDRNRTSPFAFLGNRFEFRMPGASSSVSVSTTVLNTIMAESISTITDKLENSKDFYKDLKKIIADLYKKHSKIIYNGNSYSKEWEIEAKNRGLKNIKCAPEAFKSFIDNNSIKMFEKFNVYRKEELISRYKIKLEKYIKNIELEAKIMIEMVSLDILPQVLKYANFLKDTIDKIDALEYEKDQLNKLINLINSLNYNIDKLNEELNIKKDILDEKAKHFSINIKNQMEVLRQNVDILEEIVPKEYWPMPTYVDILSV